MRIGIDIDGVLTNIEQFVLDYLSKYCVENNIEYNISSHFFVFFEIIKYTIGIYICINV